MPTTLLRRLGAVALLLSFALAAAFAPRGGSGAVAQEQATGTGTPCGSAVGSTASAGTTAITDTTAAATPSGDQATMEFDQMYIDMNIPHHASIISLSAAALTRLENPRLRAIATGTILEQTVEIGDLRNLREKLYGDSLPQPMDETTLAMMSSMPGMEGLDPAGMAMQLDPAAMAAQICAAENADLTFIDLTIAHHEAAVVMAQAALDQAQSDELQAMAAHALRSQQAQIDELQDIRTSITG